MAELCLNHRLKGVVGVYDRAERIQERARALQRWADHVDKICTGSNVANLKLPECTGVTNQCCTCRTISSRTAKRVTSICRQCAIMANGEIAPVLHKVLEQLSSGASLQ